MSDWVHEFTQSLNTDAETAFRAMTSPDMLKIWFAEHVTIEPRQGGRFSFWGKHTYGAPSHPGIESALKTFETGRAMSFDWPLLDRASEVTMTIEDADTGIGLKVSHRFDREPALERAESFVDDLWRLHLGALWAHIEGHPVNLPDFADPHPMVRNTIYIDAPRSMVWRALTEPELLDQWFTKSATIDLEAGTLDFGWSYEVDGETVSPPPMKLLEVRAEEELVMSWPDWRGDASVPNQRVTWTLEDEGDGTRLTLVHDGFTRTVDLSDYPYGWLGFLLGIQRVAQGAAEPAQ